MKRNKKVVGLAFALALVCSPEKELQAAVIEGTAPEDTVSKPLSKSVLGKIAIPDFTEPDPVIVSPSETLTTPTTSYSTPERVAEDLANEAFIKNVLTPPLIEAGFTIVEPINENVEIVNQPDQFIVTNDGEYGSQFSVQNVPSSRQKNIAIGASGPLPVLIDGAVFGLSAFDGRLAHNEGSQIMGHDFDPNNPAAAIPFIAGQNDAGIAKSIINSQYSPS